MTAQETLIEVNTSLQAIGASRTRKFYPEEIEWYVNKMENRFIQNCVRRKENDQNLFEIDEMYRDAIRELIPPELYIPVNYSTTGTFGSIILPTDYSYLLDTGACGETCTTFRSNLLQSKGYQIIGIPYPADSTDGGHQYFKDLTVQLNGTTIYSRTGYYTYPAAFQLVEEIASNTTIAMDRIGSFIKPGYLLLLVPNLISGDNVFTINYETSITKTSTVLNAFTTNETDAAQGPVNIPTRSVVNSNTFNSGTTPYFKTSHKEVTTRVIGSTMVIDTTTNFIVNGMVISYIRKPKRFSVSLNVGLEIAPEFHNQICDMTVSHIRERLGDPKYQTGLIDSKQ